MYINIYICSYIYIFQYMQEICMHVVKYIVRAPVGVNR